MATTGQNLNAALSKKGVSKRELSREAGVSYRTVTRIASGDRLGTIDTWMRFAEVLGCEISELIGDKRG